jgi:hypothetical protein
MHAGSAEHTEFAMMSWLCMRDPDLYAFFAFRVPTGSEIWRVSWLVGPEAGLRI